MARKLHVFSGTWPDACSHFRAKNEVLAKKEIGAMRSSEDCTAIEFSAENAEGKRPEGEGRRVAGHVRQAAREAARNHGMTMGEFLSEAILAYAEQLDEAAASSDRSPFDSIEDRGTCEHRLAVLEQRVRAIEMSARQENLMARRLLVNLVERPWLRSRNY